jgi:acetyltransferase-like isoleucine patch superfamily enzyme
MSSPRTAVSRLLSLRRRGIESLVKAQTRLIGRGLELLWGLRLGAGATFVGRPLIRGREITLGRFCVLDSARFNNPLGSSRRCILRTYPGGRITIGDYFAATGVTIVAAREVVIGDHVTIGAEASIVDTDFHAIDYRLRLDGLPDTGAAVRPVRIGSHVWIGARALILKGVVVGDRSVVAAGAVVSRSVPADSLVAGNPARVVKTYDWS